MSSNTDRAKGVSARANVLVVDDNPENLRLVTDILSKQGYKVRPAPSGELAIRSARGKLPDIVLLDIRMPGMDGYEVCRILKSSPETAKVPIIFISALNEEEDKARAFQAGGVDYLTKPFTETEVLARVETHLKLHGMQQHLEELVVVRTRELQAAYEMVSRSEAKYRGLFDDALDMIHIVDQNGMIIDANYMELKTLGYTKEEYFGKPLLDIIHPDHRGAADRALKRVMKGQKVKNYETVLVCKSGWNLDVEVNAVPLLKNGKCVATRVIMRDITARKKAQAALRRSHSLYKESQKIAKMGHWQLDIATNHLSWSDEIFRIFEVSRSNFGASYEAFLSLVHPDDREFVDAAYTNSLKNRTRYDIVHRLLLSDGREKYVHNKCRTDYNEQGEPVRSLGTLQDITERKLSEEQIKKSKEEWERSFAAIGDIVTIQDMRQRIIRVNRKGCDTLAARAQDLEGKFCYEVFRGADMPCAGCPVAMSIKDFSVHSAEITHQRLGKTFVVSASPICDAEGKISGIVHFAKDITEQKMLEGQLRQAQKMEAIGTLAGGIAHDFNNILTPILGYAEMALEAVSPDDSIYPDLQEIFKAARRARELVRQILTFSRQADKALQPLKIQFVVKEALKLIRASIPSTIEIRQDIDLNCGAVLADPTQVHQVIMNLCANAYHAMRERGGVLGVKLRQLEFDATALQAKSKLDLKPGTYVELEVSDSGHGMSRVLLDKIFEPYFTTKAKGEGTGLGLSVVHGIVKSFHGDIAVDSKLGSGSVFRVYLPAINVDSKGYKEKAQELLPTGNERILVLDDEKVIVEMQRQLIESLGYRVATFTDSEEAMDAVRSHPDDFDLIITDMTMPKATGVELAEEVFRIRPGMPIILCTGFSELISEEKAKAMGIREFIMKPVVRSDLAKIIRKVLDGE